MMTMGDLAQLQSDAHRYEPKTRDELLKSARAGYGHVAGRSDEELLTLQASGLSRLVAERTRDLNYYKAKARELELLLEKAGR